MDWGYKIIEINGVECLKDQVWLAGLPANDREVIDDESSFVKRFGLGWNYVERIAMIRLQHEYGLADMHARFLGRIGSLHGTSVGALFRVSSLGNKFSNVAAFVLALGLLVLGSSFIWQTATATLHSILVFLLFVSSLLIAMGFVFQSFRPWAIFQRCEKYRQALPVGARIRLIDVESTLSTSDSQIDAFNPKINAPFDQHVRAEKSPGTSKSGARKERDTAIGIIVALLDMDKNQFNDEVDAKAVGEAIENCLIGMQLPARQGASYADWIRDARLHLAAGQINRQRSSGQK